MSGNLKPFDPIVVAEQRQRIAAHRELLAKADKAASALIWFNEHALSDPDQVSVTAGLSAYATSGADVAGAYVARAAKRFAAQVLTAAIEDAKADLANAPRVTKRAGGVE